MPRPMEMLNNVHADPPPARRQRDLFAWSLLASLVLWCAMCVPFYLGRIYTSDDLWAFHLPLRQFYADCLARGEAFDWLPDMYGGFYVSGEGQLGAYHPLHWLLYRFLPLDAAFDLELLLSYPFMLAGMFFFLRRAVGRSDAAMAGAMVFTFSGFNLLHFVHPNAVAVVAHLPWLLWAIDVAFRERQRKRVVTAEAAIALLTASQLLLGYPQYVWYSLLAEGAYALYLATANRKGRLISFSARLGSFKLIGLLLGGVQLLPTIDVLRESSRDVVSSEFIHSGALHPLNVFQFIGPYLFKSRVVGGNTHEFGLYIGAAPLLLLVWLLCRWKTLRGIKPFATFALVLGALAFVLALGQWGGLYHLQTLLPLANKFRLPARYIMLVHLAVAFLFAAAVADLARSRERGHSTFSSENPRAGTARHPQKIRMPPFLLWRIVAAGLVVALAGGFIWGSDHVASLPLRLAGPVLLAVAAGLITLAVRGRTWALVGLVLFTAADLGAYGLSYGVIPNSFALSRAVSTVPPRFEKTGEFKPLIATELRDPARHPIRTGDQFLLQGWRQIDGYAGLEPARGLDYRTLPALRAAGVQWVWRRDSTEEVDGLMPHDEHWRKVPDPLPPLRLVSRVMVSESPHEDIHDIPLETTALVDRPANVEQGPPGDADLIDYAPGRIHVLTRTPTRQMLIFAERFHPGWTVTIDGQAQTPCRVNGDFLGCLVDAGRHEVTFRFLPHSLVYGKLLSALGAVVLALACAWRWNRSVTA